ncbi:MAG: hypothetical protein FD167_3064 [bacterium]|nr:MAG: hypothetical protein FD167_3064 [bacterium]
MILLMLFLMGGTCKCVLAHSSCYLESEQEVCLDEQSSSDSEHIATNHHENDKDDDRNCCPIQCLFKNTDGLAGEPTSFYLSKNSASLLTIDYSWDFTSKPNSFIKPIWEQARAPSPNFNLQSQNSILRI